MQQIGLPAGMCFAIDELNRRQSKPRKAQIVVRPVIARNIGIRRSGTLVERRTDQEKPGCPVRCFSGRNIAGRNVRRAIESRYGVQRRFPVRTGAIERHENS